MKFIVAALLALTLTSCGLGPTAPENPRACDEYPATTQGEAYYEQLLAERDLLGGDEYTRVLAEVHPWVLYMVEGSQVVVVQEGVLGPHVLVDYLDASMLIWTHEDEIVC